MSGHGSCPLCRHVFLVVDTASEPESSDGGEYVPSSDFEEENSAMDYDDEGSEAGSDWRGDDDGWTEPEEDMWDTSLNFGRIEEDVSRPLNAAEIEVFSVINTCSGP